jgi:hypothetical protein
MVIEFDSPVRAPALSAERTPTAAANSVFRFETTDDDAAMLPPSAFAVPVSETGAVAQVSNELPP